MNLAKEAIRIMMVGLELLKWLITQSDKTKLKKFMLNRVKETEFENQ